MAKPNRGGERGALGGRTIAQDKTLKGIVKRTQDLKKEQYRIVDRAGRVVLEKKGDKHSVAATVGEKREYLKDAVSIHNHPEGGTFSPDDIPEFGYGAREIVAASPEGTYRLINNKYGTKEAYDGWVKLKEGAERIPEQSQAALLKQARTNLANSKTTRELESISNKWSEIRARDGREAADAYYSGVKQRFEALTEQHRQEVKDEARRLETQPFHDYYKAHAAEYGFTYRFERRKRKG